MKFYVKQKAVSLKDQFTVCDEQDQTVYEAKSGALKGRRLCVTDTAGKEVATLRKKKFTLAPGYRISVEGQPNASIKMSANVKNFKVSGYGWKVKGNLTLSNYEIRSGRDEIATIHKKAMSFGDAYVLDVDETKTEPLCALCVLLAIDECFG